MADNKNDDIVFTSVTGDKYHIIPECPCIKNRFILGSFKWSKIGKKRTCQWCGKEKDTNSDINPLINNNPHYFRNNIINNENNINKNSNFLFKKSKSINPVFNNNLKKILIIL